MGAKDPVPAFQNRSLALLVLLWTETGALNAQKASHLREAPLLSALQLSSRAAPTRTRSTSNPTQRRTTEPASSFMWPRPAEGQRFTARAPTPRSPQATAPLRSRTSAAARTSPSPTLRPGPPLGSLARQRETLVPRP